MFAKLLLIAFVCASVSQVHGEDVEIAIINALKRVKAMNDNALDRYDEAVQDADAKYELVYSKTCAAIEMATRVRENSRRSVRSVAANVERRAREAGLPQSVFECIIRNEDNANSEIETYTNKFATDMERLRGTKQENINTAAKTYDNMEDALQARYVKTVMDLGSCHNTICVNNVVNSFSTYLNNMYATIRRVEGLINNVLVNFERDTNTFFTNTNIQTNRIKSSAIRNIKNCYFSARSLFFQEA